MSFQPGYVAYLDDARDSKSNLFRVPLNNSFEIDPALTIAKIEELRPTLVLFTNPENPTGTLTSLSVIETIVNQTQNVVVAGSNRETHPVYLVDEAYIDFADSPAVSAINLLDQYSNVFVLRTLSKSFGLAGLRAGYVIAAPELIYPISVVRQPYSFSNITQALARVAFENSSILMQPIEHIKKSRNALRTWLTQQKYQGYSLKIPASQTNFLLIGFDPQSSDYLDLPTRAVDFLITRGVMVRKVAVPGYFRISIGTDSELAEFKSAFAEFLD
jgi:histidinol-phosphate aminotransferase